MSRKPDMNHLHLAPLLALNVRIYRKLADERGLRHAQSLRPLSRGITGGGSVSVHATAFPQNLFWG